jgi:predicted MFS family arabinose efflux permease
MNDLFQNNRRLLIFVLVSNFMMYFGFQIWQTVFNNFAVEQLSVGPETVGWIQALREVPGLLGFTLGFLALYFSEVRIMSVSAILLGLGVFLSGQSYTIPFFLVSTFIMSVGFHYYFPCNSSVILMLAQTEHAPKMLGRLGSQGAIAAIAASLVVIFLAGPLGYRNLFMIVGGMVAVVGVALLPMRGIRDCLPARRQVRLRKRYWLYYTLSILLGSRRHIFSTFALFLLARDYHVTVQTIAILFLIVNVINIYGMRVAARIIVRLGERLTLSIIFAILAVIFLGYAFIPSLPVLYVLFVLDNLTNGFNMALQTYFQKIALTKEEMTSNLATEQTMNHLSAVIVPVVGGAIWVALGSQAPFLFGVAIVLVALLLAQFMRVPPAAPQPAPAA